METEGKELVPSGTSKASGSKRPGETSASDYALQEGVPNKSTKTEGSIVSPRRPESHLMPAGPSMDEEGNPKHRMILKLSGYLGHRIDISKRFKKTTYVDLNVANIREALGNLLYPELLYRLIKRRSMTLKDVNAFTQYATPLVVNAVMKALYARLRMLHFALNERRSRYTERPSFPSEAEIPAPFASLIQGIGRIRIRDYPEDLLIAPTYPEGTTHEGASAEAWNYAAYMSVIDELKNVGIPFRSIVMKDTTGGSWWLYKDRVNEERHELELPFPVTNFSDHSAVLRGMLLQNSEGINEVQIADLSAFKHNYGTMLREVGIGDNMLYFRALCHDDESLWRPSIE